MGNPVQKGKQEVVCWFIFGLGHFTSRGKSIAPVQSVSSPQFRVWGVATHSFQVRKMGTFANGEVTSQVQRQFKKHP